MRPCPDCAVEPGQVHEPGCDVARCKQTGNQALQCMGEDDVAALVADGDDPEDYEAAQHPGSCLGTTWTGRWPGQVECEELGWWCVFTPGRGFTQVTAGTPGFRHDLNRLILAHCTGELVWNIERERLVLP